VERESIDSTPVPVTASVTGLDVASEGTETVPDRPPVCDGVKTTSKVQEPPATMDWLEQVSTLPREKSPVAASAPMLSAPLPGSDTVTVSGAEGIPTG
jgi:hypothetical protein